MTSENRPFPMAPASVPPGDNTLGSFALSKRLVSTMVQKDSDSRPVQGLNTKPLPEPGKDNIQEISIALLVRNWDQYNGRHTRVEGLYYQLFIKTVGQFTAG